MKHLVDRHTHFFLFPNFSSSPIVMAFVQRLLALGFVPILALLSLQIISPETFEFVQHAVQPYVSGTPLGRFFPDASTPRSETPIIMTSVTHWSHYEKIAAIALELATLGYPVTFITGRIFEADVLALHPNVQFSAMLGGDDKMSEEDIQTWLALPAGPARESFIEKKVLVDSMPNGHASEQAQFQSFREKYGSKKPLIFMHDQAATGHYPILLGAPGIRPDASISISIAPLTMDSNDTFPFRAGGVPHTGPGAKEVHWKATLADREEKYNKELNEYWWAKLREMGAVRDTYPYMMQGMNTLSDYLVTLGIPQFEFPRSDLRPNIRYYGALKTVNKVGAEKPQLPPWWDDISKAKKEGKKIIAVSQGTVETNPEDLVLPTLEALKDRNDVLVIATFVTTEPEDVPNLVVPTNARVAKFVPYGELLPLVSRNFEQ
jgi:hypothetical protein